MASPVIGTVRGGTRHRRSTPRRVLVSWLVAGCCAVVPAHVAWGALQETPRTLEISKNDFTEQLVPRAKVSGGVRVGLLAGEVVSSVDPRLVIRIPEGAAGQLCIQIRSANGEYRGQIERAVGGITPGDYRIRLPTARTAFFRDRDANELTVLAYTGSSCLEGPQTILPASWSDGIAENGFWVFVNAGRSRTAVVATGPDGEMRRFACEPARVDLAVIYDQRCFVEVPGNSRYTFRIERSSSLTRLPSVNLPVHW